MKRTDLDGSLGSAIDAEHVEQTARTRGWELMCKRLALTARQQSAVLRNKTTNHDETQYARGYLDALEHVFGLPEQMMEELRQQAGHEPT